MPYSDSTSQVVITAQGTAASPIIIKALPSSSGQVPTIENSVVFYGASHVIFDGFIVRNSSAPGVVIEQGASAITVQNSQIYNNAIGIWIGNGAGISHQLLNNSVYNNKIQGIAIDAINNAEGQETLIQKNQIYQNGSHGIDIYGNYYIVDHNTVWSNGISVSGSSGIHTWAASSTGGTGQHNTITYNITYSNKDNTTDGNGIQLDKWCDNNVIAFNTAFLNDGAGIILFDAASNIIYNNTLYSNAVDPGHSHAYKGDLVLASDFVNNTNHTLSNILFNNLAYATVTGAVPIYVDKSTSGNQNAFQNNDLFTSVAQGSLYYWGAAAGSSINDWNSKKIGNPDFQLDPSFVDKTTLPTGLALAANSPVAQKGTALSTTGLTDLNGAAINAATPPIGAYTASRTTTSTTTVTPAPTTITSTAISPVNGACGTANDKSSLFAPTKNLCSTGTASTVSKTRPWNWTCVGSNGGSSASCTSARSGH